MRDGKNIQFTKYHGTGNDFIMLDSRKNDMTDRSADTIARMCDRHFGIGADGLIILEESEGQDFRMSYFNADGKPGSMCGNGGRCATAFASEQGWIAQSGSFEASDGLHSGSVLTDKRVKISLNDVEGVKHLALSASDYPSLSGLANPASCFLNTGSPHLVLFVDQVDSVDVFTLGRKLRYDPQFTGGTNVNFVERTDEGIRVRTYERGVENETLSCGTGLTAAAIAASLQWSQIDPPIKVSTRGGELEVGFKAVPGADNKEAVRQDERFTEITLIGPTTRVFDGTIKL